jgi:hypothetical protein
MAHVQIKRVPSESPWSNGDTRWAVLVDGVDLAHSITPDGLRLEFDPVSASFKVGLILRAEQFDADLPDSVLDGLMTAPTYVAQPSDCPKCQRVADADAQATARASLVRNGFLDPTPPGI